MKRLDGKVGIVTGGGGAGGSGLGAAIATALARDGAHVVVTDILEAQAQVVAARLRESGADARAFALDVTDGAAWASVVNATTSTYDRLDMLVNSAGINVFDVDALDLAAWDHVFTTNTRGVFLGMRSVIPEMVARRGGAVVNITSAAGSVGLRGMHMAYGASKAAIRQMTKSAAVEFGASGVRVNAIAPGMLARPRTTARGAPERGASRAVEEPATRDASRDLRSLIPLGRTGTADDIAAIVVFVLSDEAAHVTGTELLADGGYLASR